LKRPRRFLLAEEVRRLVAASKEPTLTIILPATTTGFRIGEILALRWGRIPRWRRRWRSLRMLAQRTTFLHAPPNSSPLAFLASHVLRFSQRASFYRYIPNVFSNARGPLTVRNRCRTPAIPWRANQNRSSNTQFCKNLATRPNFFVRSLVITVAIQFSRVVLRARHAFGVPGVRVPRQLFCGTAPPACLRHCDGVLAVLAGSTGVFLTGQKSLAHQNELPRQQGGPR
jgi:hypothetical protein